MEIKLKTRSLILVSKLVSKMGIKLELKGKSQEELGTDLIWQIVNNLHLAEKEFYELLGQVSGYAPEAIEDMDVMELTEEIRLIYKKILSFFGKPTSA